MAYLSFPTLVAPGQTPERLRLGARLALWLSAWSERRDLGRLDAAALHDIGITQREAAVEAARCAFDVTARSRNWPR